jgi:putative ABC transport system permease protein
MPYENPDELVAVDWRTHASEQYPLSVPDFLDYQKQNRSFTQMAAYLEQDYNLVGVGDPERLKGQMVSAEFFPLLNVKPILGGHLFPKRDKLGALPFPS